MAEKKTAKKEKKENGKVDLKEILGDITVSYTHLTLPTTPVV